MLRTVSKIARISSFDPCTLISYFFRIATPSSNPSIESSPSPSTNNGFVAVDVLGRDVFEVERAYDELFQFAFEVSHVSASAVVRFQIRYQFASAPRA